MRRGEEASVREGVILEIRIQVWMAPITALMGYRREREEGWLFKDAEVKVFQDSLSLTELVATTAASCSLSAHLLGCV